MKEDFVTFELAKKLKEKGFNKPCVAYYIPNCSKLYFNTAILLKKSTVADCLFSNNTTPIGYICSTFIDAPIISQVLKWLREEKNIFVVVFIDDDSDYPVTYNIFNGADCVYHHHEEYFALSEWSKCELAGIKYAIDNLI